MSDEASPASVASPATEFPFRLRGPLRLLLLFWGVRAASAGVRLEADRLVARFGFVTAVVALSNIESWDITGPYRWWRAVGIRQTLGKPDVSFGTSTHGGLRVRLRTPVKIAWVRARDFYVTVDDLEGLGAALTARGIQGEDRRQRR